MCVRVCVYAWKARDAFVILGHFQDFILICVSKRIKNFSGTFWRPFYLSFVWRISCFFGIKKEPTRFCKTKRIEFAFVTSHARTIVFIIYIKYDRSYTTILFSSSVHFSLCIFHCLIFALINSNAFLLVFFDTVV